MAISWTVSALTAEGADAGAVTSVPTSKIPGFRALNLETVKDYVAERPDLGERVGPSGSKDAWTVSFLF